MKCFGKNLLKYIGKIIVCDLHTSFLLLNILEGQSTFLQDLLNFSYSSFALKFGFLLIPVKISMYRYPLLDNFLNHWVHFRAIVIVISYENTNLFLYTNSCTTSLFSLFFLLLDRQVIVLSQELQQVSFSKTQVAWWHTLQDSHSVYNYPRWFFKQLVHFRVIIVMSYGNRDS
jgi:hypothetical protein